MCKPGSEVSVCKAKRGAAARSGNPGILCSAGDDARRVDIQLFGADRLAIAGPLCLHDVALARQVFEPMSLSARTLSV
jgi:hypothetical protein